RHPQYFALMIFTGIMTLQSVWILKSTFGIGWLTADQTLILWYLMLSAYVVIAWIEDVHLSRTFGDEWKEYRSRVGFLLPYVHFKSSLLEGLVSIILPIIVLNLGLPSVFAI
ncbi:MAG: hypothetical protein ACFFCP_02825, partial [Promethearchaeota archaeon]